MKQSLAGFCLNRLRLHVYIHLHLVPHFSCSQKFSDGPFVPLEVKSYHLAPIGICIYAKVLGDLSSALTSGVSATASCQGSMSAGLVEIWDLRALLQVEQPSLRLTPMENLFKGAAVGRASGMAREMPGGRISDLGSGPDQVLAGGKSTRAS
jgi:hypothetical protein